MTEGNGRMGVGAFTSMSGSSGSGTSDGAGLLSLSPALARSSLMSLESFHSPYLCGRERLHCSTEVSTPLPYTT